ncbi:hypothetical protein [Nocardia gamkensis]|uniref:PPE family domain-containing protein n=1 Tax=Nocardia gamkensis TaxID=352869 RepID=A0A7X6R3K8_9NOCA|nr:hypothetical protein [Nocardia gamkensis]NKY27564.1 hypothetical protein [Nocardia gamkensis]NQE71737.1 A-agglutinin anchorage subunit [Nocardia gamkensis]
MGNPYSGMPQFQIDQGLGSAMWRSVTDWIAGEEAQPEVDAAEVQGRYNQQRDGVRSKAADVGFQGEFRPREVLDADEFERHDVATLRQKVDQIDLNAVSDLVTAWNTIADRHEASLKTFTTAMERATDDSVWRGEARNAAASAVGDYAAQGAQVSNAARLTGNKLAELQTGLEPTKQLVPHAPEHRSGWDNLRGFVVGRDWRNDDVAEYNAKTEALRVLRTVYAPVVMESDTNVPVIPRPVSTANPNGTGDGGNPRGTNNGSGNPSGTSSPSSNPSDTNSTDDPSTPSSTEPSDTTSETPESTSTDPASTTENSTTPASATPATTPASTTPAPSTSPTTPGTPHPSTPGSPGSPSHPGGPGVSVPSKGAPNNPNAVPAAARTGASPGRAGTSGMGGMAPGARGGKSDEESTKGIPDYLITQEHGNELTGLDELPKSVPPVIGDNPR